MGSWRYASENDPDAEAQYSIRADARLRMAFLGRDVAQWGESYVRLFNDDCGPGYDLLHGVLDLEKVLAKLKEEAALHVLAAGGTYKAMGEVLDISEHEAERRYAELWTERQEQHARTDDRTPIEPALRHLMRDLGALDDWCAARLPLDGEFQVRAGLVFPHLPTAEVRTQSEVEDAGHATVMAAENEVMVAQFIVERESAVAAALKRLARRPGLAHSKLWPKRSVLPEYVVARDGRYLGRVGKMTYDSAQLKGVRWNIEDADPKLGWEQKRDLKFLTLEEAASFLDRNSPPAPPTGPATGT